MKAMKTKMLIFVFLLGITDLFAQTLYVPGTIVKGKNASYYCSTEYEILIKVNNVNNVDTTDTMYYDDGSRCVHGQNCQKTERSVLEYHVPEYPKKKVPKGFNLPALLQRNRLIYFRSL